MSPAKDVNSLSNLSRKFSIPAVEIVAARRQPAFHQLKRPSNLLLADHHRVRRVWDNNASASASALSPAANGCLMLARVRMFAVVLSIGAGSMFLVSLDSVVDNLIPVAREYLTNLYQSEAKADLAWSWVVSSRVYGLAFGCLCALLLSHRAHTRKRPLLIAFVLNLAGGLLSSLIRVPHCGVALACFGRFASGVGSGLAQVIGSAMLAEIPPIRYRGTVLASLTVWACVGELVGMFLSLDSVLGTEQSWHIALGFPVLIVPIALPFLLSAPDSPRALLMAGREEEALQSLQFYQMSDDWLITLKDIKMEMAQQHCLQHQHRSPVDLKSNNRQIGTGNHRRSSDDKKQLSGADKWPLLFPKSSITSNAEDKSSPTLAALLVNRFSSGKFIRPFLLGAFVLTFAHLDDWLWISYSTQAFQNAGVSSSQAQRSSLLMSIPQALISIALLFCFDCFTRRQLLIWPTLGSICCASLAIYSTSVPSSRGEGEGGILNAQILPLLAALDLCAAAIASESAYTVVPELFPQRDRVIGTALIGVIQNLFGGLLTTIALPLMNSHGIVFVLAPFILLNLFYIIVCTGYLPETRGKSFHEISEHFDGSLPSCLTVRGVLDWLKACPRWICVLLRKSIIQLIVMLSC